MRRSSGSGTLPRPKPSPGALEVTEADPRAGAVFDCNNGLSNFGRTKARYAVVSISLHSVSWQASRRGPVASAPDRGRRAAQYESRAVCPPWDQSAASPKRASEEHRGSLGRASEGSARCIEAFFSVWGANVQVSKDARGAVVPRRGTGGEESIPPSPPPCHPYYRREVLKLSSARLRLLTTFPLKWICPRFARQEREYSRSSRC